MQCTMSIELNNKWQVKSILQALFPVPKEESKRVVTFANQDDFISFRHHVYSKPDRNNIELKEVGPRFQMRCKENLVINSKSRLLFNFSLFIVYEIKLGTIDEADSADTEWRLHSFMNTAKKRRYL